MKKLLSIFAVACLLSSCSGNASWAYAFVKYDGVSYEITEEEVSEEHVGETIGEVKRDVSGMDTVENYVDANFDSNELLVGTKLFAAIDDNEHIIYEKDGKYFIAKSIP